MAISPFRARQALRWQEVEKANIAARPQPNESPEALLSRLWERVASAAKAIVGLSGAATVLTVFVFFVISIFAKSVSIQPLAVPKSLAEAGFTSDVAALRLRDALNTLVEKANTVHKHRTILPQADEINIVVPVLGVPVQAMAAHVRAWFGMSQHQTISGELTIERGLLYLTVRLDGKLLFTSAQGVDLKWPTDLFPDAAREVLRITQPYVFAASMSGSDKNLALSVVDSIIARSSLLDQDALFARNLKGNILSDLGQGERSIAEFEKLISLDPLNATWHRDMGLAYFALRDLKKAHDEILKALSIDPQFATLYIDLGRLHEEQGDKKEALTDYSKAVQLDPLDDIANYDVGVMLVSMGQHVEAIRSYRSAIALNPINPDYHINLGASLVAIQDYKEAIAEYHKAIGLDAKIARVHYDLALAMIQAENLSDATTELKAAIALDAGNVYYQSKLRDVANDLGPTDDTLRTRKLGSARRDRRNRPLRSEAARAY